jgi:hypothetical protein
MDMTADAATLSCLLFLTTVCIPQLHLLLLSKNKNDKYLMRSFKSPPTHAQHSRTQGKAQRLPTTWTTKPGEAGVTRVTTLSMLETVDQVCDRIQSNDPTMTMSTVDQLYTMDCCDNGERLQQLLLALQHKLLVSTL